LEEEGNEEAKDLIDKTLEGQDVSSSSSSSEDGSGSDQIISSLLK